MAKVKVAKGYQTGEVDEADLQTAVAEGWSPVTADEAVQIGEQRRAGTTGQQIIAGGESVARGLSFGLSDAAAEALGADMSEAKARKERLGYAGSGLEIAGAVAPALLSGGTGTLGTLARLTPAGRTAAVGTSIARGRGLLGAAAAGAYEGGLQGVGTEISEASLGDHELTAERALSGFATGAGIGAGLGFGTGAIGRGLGKGKEGVAGLMRRAPDVAEGAGSKLSPGFKDKVTKLWAGASGADETALRDTIELLGDKEGRRILIEGPEALTKRRTALAQTYKSGVDSANDAWDDLIKTTGGNRRVGNAERLMAPELNATAHRSAVDFVRAQAKRVDEILASNTDDAGKSLLTSSAKRDLAEIKRLHSKTLKEIEKQGISGAKAFREVDRLRQEIGDISSGRYNEFKRSAKREVGENARMVDEFRKAARDHTVDQNIYGDAAKAHAEDLTAWSEAIDAHRTLRSKSPSLAKLLEKGATDADVSPLLTLARNRAGSETKRTAFDAVFDKRLKAIEVLKKNHDLPPEVRTKIDKFERSVKSMEREFKKTADTARKVEALHTVRQTGETNFSPSSVTTSTASTLGGLAGFTVGGPIGALVGAGIGALSKPANTIRTMAALREMVGGARLGESNVLAGVGKLIDGVRPPKGSTARAVTRATIAARTNKDRPEQRRRQLLAVRDKVNAMAADPTRVADILGDPAMWASAPNVARSRMITAAKAVAFLKSVEPVSYKPAFVGAVEIVDPVQLNQYERYVEAVADPLGTMGRLERGTLTLEHSRALQVVYPKMFERLREGVLEEVGERQNAGKPIAFQARMQLGLLLDMPLDESMKPGYALPPRQPEPPQSGPSGPVNAGGASDIEPTSSMTMSERIERGGERT